VARAFPCAGRPPPSLVALATAVLVVVVGATSAFAVRALVDKGIVGLAPVGATPSTPERGELVLEFTFGHTMGDPEGSGSSCTRTGD
jgi:hypothetical protein